MAIIHKKIKIMKSKSLKIATVILLICCSSVAANAQNSFNISGSWSLDSAKSEMNRLPLKVASQKLNMELAGNMLKINSVNGNINNRYQNSLDGKPATVSTASGSSITSTIIRDGSILKRELKVSEPNKPENLMYNRLEIWTLSADGQLLTIKQLVKPGSGQGDYSFTAVYQKDK